MRKIIIVLTCIGLSALGADACEICGGGVGNFNPYMFPHLSKNYAGFGYSYRVYHTHLHDEYGNPIMNSEKFRTFQLTGQFAVNSSMQLMTVIPFQSNRQTGPEGEKNLHKLSDIMLFVNYRVFDKKNKNNFRQTLLAGAGAKLPTGQYAFDDDNQKEVGNANFQAGTGSTDLIVHSFYNVQFKNWAATTGVNYKFNSSNKQDYQFGNRIQGLLQIKYIRNFGRFSVIPNTGLHVEKSAMDKAGRVTVQHTGGSNFQFSGGVDVNTRKWALGISYLKSIKQDLGEGHIYAFPACNIHFGYTF